jgi:hypothetical protein
MKKHERETGLLASSTAGSYGLLHRSVFQPVVLPA